MSKKVNKKHLYEIKQEWNDICDKRQEIIDNGQDISLVYVTSPCILNSLNNDTPKAILDVGCGSGYLTNQLASICETCYGIDISNRSVDIAKSKYKQNNLFFINSSISEFNTNIKFSHCVSNMVFMTDPDLKKSLKNIYELLDDNGILLAMITHPCFWPKYWKYQDEDWFDYNKEIFIQHNFKTSLSNSLGVTTHIHRPLYQYINEIISTGFEIICIEEPYPIETVPSNYIYEYPRFLFIKCKKATL